MNSFFFVLGLIFLLALSGTAAGLRRVWPGLGWSWKKARLLIISSIFLAGVITYIVFLIIAVGNVEG